MKLALQIAAGIVIASAVLFVGRLLFVAAAVKTVEHEVEEMQANLRMRAEQSRAQQAARRTAELQKQAALALQRIEQIQLEARRESLEANAARRRERAWQEFYRQPAGCEQPTSWNEQVECGNRYIRAKREFDARWEAAERLRAQEPLVVRGSASAQEG